MEVSTSPEAAAPISRKRLVGLDGIRGIAALFVVFNHIYLRAWPGYPVDHAPFWAGWFIYGRFAVVIFIVLSGFSLAVSPVRAGGRLDSTRKFARRRAWRILPPYWAALVFSLLMTWFVVARPLWPVPDGKSVLVHGLLLQDVFPVATPNLAFWSIAIEVQLYVIFPILLLLARRVHPVAMLATVAVPIITIGLLAPHEVWANTVLVQGTPDLAVLFAVGVMAAGVLAPGNRLTHWPWAWFALVAAVPVVALIAVKGSVWTIDNFFWVDLAWGPAIACLLAAIVTGHPAPLVRALDARPIRGLGSFSYSLYLTHAPIVIAVYYGLMRGLVPQGVPMFLVLVAVVVPLTVTFARLFASVFEIPFQRHRGWGAFREAVPRRARRPEPANPEPANPEPPVIPAERPAPVAAPESVG